MSKPNRKGWDMTDSINSSQSSSKDEILEQFLTICQNIESLDQTSIKNINVKHHTIKKHYAQQKCRIEHQFKYIVTLLEQKKKEMLSQLTQHELQLDQIFTNINQELQQISQVVISIHNDITSNRNEIVYIDDETFNQVLGQFEEQIQESQTYKRDLLTQKINLIIIEEWSNSHQDKIKNLISSCITFKDYEKQIETQNSIELSASTCSEKHSLRSSSDFREHLIVSFDQKYYMPKQSEQSVSEDVHDSCESDFLKEWVEQQ